MAETRHDTEAAMTVAELAARAHLPERVVADVVRESLREVQEVTSATSDDPVGSGLTPADAAVYRRIGGLRARPDAVPSAAMLSIVHRNAEVFTGLTVAEAADLLGVTDSRVRQRITAHTLVAVKRRGQHRLPRFQFTNSGEVPGWADVAAALPAYWTLLEIDGFLTTAQLDLVVHGDPVTPLTWLTLGQPTDAVIALLADADRLP